MSQNTENSLLFHFKYDNNEWRIFTKFQSKQKKIDNIIYGALILIFGLLILVFVKGTPILFALIITLPLALFFSYIRYRKSQKYFKRKVKNPQIKIFENHLEINGLKKILISKKYWLLSVVSKSKNDLNYICFEIAWNAHKGRTHDEFRIPIPSNEVAKAEEIVAFYKNL
ncbi:MAG: hypothetical protein QM486_11670 [Flavobacteriaceae bacterium]